MHLSSAIGWVLANQLEGLLVGPLDGAKILFTRIEVPIADADEQCPALPAGARKIHWPLTDPAKATGTEDEIMAAFRATRDEVEARVRRLLKELAA